MGEFGLRHRKLALRGLQLRPRRFHLSLACEILAFRIVDFLLRNQARLGGCDAVQPRVLEVEDLALRFDSAQLMLSVGNLIGEALDRCLVLLKLRL